MGRRRAAVSEVTEDALAPVSREFVVWICIWFAVLFLDDGADRTIPDATHKPLQLGGGTSYNSVGKSARAKAPAIVWSPLGVSAPRGYLLQGSGPSAPAAERAGITRPSGVANLPHHLFGIQTINRPTFKCLRPPFNTHCKKCAAYGSRVRFLLVASPLVAEFAQGRHRSMAYDSRANAGVAPSKPG